jgi:hypothetical protein
MPIPRKSVDAKRSTAESRSKRVTPDFTASYFLTQAETSALVKQGIWADDVRKIARSMGLKREQVAVMLGIPVAAVATGGQRKQLLASAHARRLVGLGKLAGQLQAMIARSDDGNNFNAMRWLAQWLFQQNAALGWTTPAAHLSTPEGQRQLSDLLARAESGAMS